MKTSLLFKFGLFVFALAIVLADYQSIDTTEPVTPSAIESVSPAPEPMPQPRLRLRAPVQSAVAKLEASLPAPLKRHAATIDTFTKRHGELLAAVQRRDNYEAPMETDSDLAAFQAAVIEHASKVNEIQRLNAEFGRLLGPDLEAWHEWRRSEDYFVWISSR